MFISSQIRIFSVALALVFGLSQPLSAQGRSTGYEITKISVEVVDTPDIQFSGSKKRTPPPGKWLEVEAEFSAEPEFTEELTFKYYVQLNKTVFVGEVTHVDIAAGKGLNSVMYISPRSISRIMEGKNLTATSIERISVEITKQGALQAFGPWKNEKSGWWTTSPQQPGYLRNKSESPFAPLYWDRYEAIKTNLR